MLLLFSSHWSLVLHQHQHREYQVWRAGEKRWQWVSTRHECYALLVNQCGSVVCPWQRVPCLVCCGVLSEERYL